MLGEELGGGLSRLLPRSRGRCGDQDGFGDGSGILPPAMMLLPLGVYISPGRSRAL